MFVFARILSPLSRHRGLFKGVPVWTPINRPADTHLSRERYLQRFQPLEEELSLRSTIVRIGCIIHAFLYSPPTKDGDNCQICGFALGWKRGWVNIGATSSNLHVLARPGAKVLLAWFLRTGLVPGLFRSHGMPSDVEGVGRGERPGAGDTLRCAQRAVAGGGQR